LNPKKNVFNTIAEPLKVHNFIKNFSEGKDIITQILEEVEQGIKSGANAPMSPGREERFTEIKGAIENLLKNLWGLLKIIEVAVRWRKCRLHAVSTDLYEDFQL